MAAYLAYNFFLNYIIQIIKSSFNIMCFNEILIPEKHCNWDVIEV